MADEVVVNVAVDELKQREEALKNLVEMRSAGLPISLLPEIYRRDNDGKPVSGFILGKGKDRKAWITPELMKALEEVMP